MQPCISLCILLLDDPNSNIRTGASSLLNTLSPFVSPDEHEQGEVQGPWPAPPPAVDTLGEVEVKVPVAIVSDDESDSEEQKYKEVKEMEDEDKDEEEEEDDEDEDEEPLGSGNIGTKVGPRKSKSRILDAALVPLLGRPLGLSPLLFCVSCATSCRLS